LKIIAFIEDYKIAKKIFDHLGIYEFGNKRAPPKAAEELAGFEVTSVLLQWIATGKSRHQKNWLKNSMRRL